LASVYSGEKDPAAHKLLTRRLIIDAGVEVVVNTMKIEELKTCTQFQERLCYNMLKKVLSSILSI